MAIKCIELQTAGFRKRMDQSTSGNECCICGRQTEGRTALHVAIDHCSYEFVTDAEAAERGEDVSLYPIGPECEKRWRKAIGGTSARLAAPALPVEAAP
ncbi:MAG TPA: hypothetical protein VGC15_20405 [Acetobacteraceae bacterium]